MGRSSPAAGFFSWSRWTLPCLHLVFFWICVKGCLELKPWSLGSRTHPKAIRNLDADQVGRNILPAEDENARSFWRTILETKVQRISKLCRIFEGICFFFSPRCQHIFIGTLNTKSDLPPLEAGNLQSSTSQDPKPKRIERQASVQESGLMWNVGTDWVLCIHHCILYMYMYTFIIVLKYI